jgi:hypothetical protein
MRNSSTSPAAAARGAKFEMPQQYRRCQPADRIGLLRRGKTRWAERWRREAAAGPKRITGPPSLPKRDEFAR